MSAASRCRACGKPVTLNRDELAVPHQDYKGRQCGGAGLPARGEPPCRPACNPVGTIGNDPQPGKAHRSTVVCDRTDHQREAAEWVTAATEQPGVFRLFIRKQ